ncbi:hypothetical protein AMELA_G00135600, partial [Ameiurus melas]
MRAAFTLSFCIYVNKEFRSAPASASQTTSHYRIPSRLTRKQQIVANMMDAKGKMSAEQDRVFWEKQRTLDEALAQLTQHIAHQTLLQRAGAPEKKESCTAPRTP